MDNNRTARGKWFEQEAHHLIEITGVQGELRDLQSGTIVRDFAIPSSASRFFNNLTQIDSSSKYWRLVTKNHRTCDSYLASVGLML